MVQIQSFPVVNIIIIIIIIIILAACISMNHLTSYLSPYFRWRISSHPSDVTSTAFVACIVSNLLGLQVLLP